MTSEQDDHSGGTAAHGAPGRVAAVHAQARQGLALTAAFVVAAFVVGLAGAGANWWPALHLFVVGAVLSAISAVTLMLSVTWSASPAPRPVVAAAQRGLLAAGAVALVVGHEGGRAWLFVSGGVSVIIAMLGLVLMLMGVRRDAVTARFAPAIEAYVAAVALGSVGMTIGVLLGTGHAPMNASPLRDAHLTLNLYGLVGLVIAGTLPFFAATQVRSKMSRRATPAAMRATLTVLAAATVLAVVGHLTLQPIVVAIGLLQYSLGLAAVAGMLPIYSFSRVSWAGPRVLQLVAGIGWWAAMTVALAITSLRGLEDRHVLQALVIGGFAQILVASLAYLAPVLRGGGHRRLTAGFSATRSWVSLVVANAAAFAALAGQLVVVAVMLSVWLADTAVGAARLRRASDRP